MDGDVLLDEEGNPEIDENEGFHNPDENGEGGWDVSSLSEFDSNKLI